MQNTIFRAFGSAQRVKIYKITRRRVPGMVPYFETVKKEFHCTAQRNLAETILEKLNGFREPRLEYARSLEDWVEDAFADAEPIDPHHESP